MTLCLLASYPKSGNTWVRALLATILEPDNALVLNEMAGSNPLLLSDSVDRDLGTDPHDLDFAQLDEVRAASFRQANEASGTSTRFAKVHSANRTLASGRRLFDAASGRAIVIVRHPFDVAVSYAHFLATTVEERAAVMLRPDARLDPPGQARPWRVSEFMGSWAEHTDSWTVNPPLPTLVVRFEDLVADTVAELERLTDFVDLDVPHTGLLAAVDRCRLPQLQLLEQQQGFDQKPRTAEVFFRAGRPGEGHALITSESRLRRDSHVADVCARLGYDLESTGAPSAV